MAGWPRCKTPRFIWVQWDPGSHCEFCSLGTGAFKNLDHWDFPGGPGVEHLPANTGNSGSIPGPERFHTPRGISASMPQLLNLRSRAPCSWRRETATVRSPCATTERGRPSPQLERAQVPRQRASTAREKVNQWRNLKTLGYWPSRYWQGLWLTTKSAVCYLPDSPPGYLELHFLAIWPGIP